MSRQSGNLVAPSTKELHVQSENMVVCFLYLNRVYETDEYRHTNKDRMAEASCPPMLTQPKALPLYVDHKLEASHELTE